VSGLGSCTTAYWGHKVPYVILAWLYRLILWVLSKVGLACILVVCAHLRDHSLLSGFMRQ
jgi:hypothetical protein